MGTTYNIKYVPSKSFPVNKERVHKKVEEILINFNKVASTYDPHSEISKINQAVEGQVIKLSRTLKILVAEAFEMNKLSQGVFDPSLSPLINLWGFGHKGRRAKAPSLDEVRVAQSYCGMKNFNFDGENLTKLNSGSELDFSAFAKGYGVDLVVLYLESLQMDDYFVEIGGEIKTRSKLKQWKIGIESPDLNNFQGVTKILPLNNGALATSGDYRNFYNDGGKKYSHGIDFSTGKPVENEIASVSVHDANSTMRADAWATALLVSTSLSQAKELLTKNNLAAFIIFRDNGGFKVFESKRWQEEFNK